MGKKSLDEVGLFKKMLIHEYGRQIKAHKGEERLMVKGGNYFMAHNEMIAAETYEVAIQIIKEME